MVSSYFQGRHQPRNPDGEAICRSCKARYSDIINSVGKLTTTAGPKAIRDLAEKSLQVSNRNARQVEL